MTYDPAIPAERIALVDLLDRVLADGVVIAGEVTLSIAELDLVTVSLRALGGRLRVVRWGCRRGESQALPVGGWTKQTKVESGYWSSCCSRRPRACRVWRWRWRTPGACWTTTSGSLPTGRSSPGGTRARSRRVRLCRSCHPDRLLLRAEPPGVGHARRPSRGGHPRCPLPRRARRAVPAWGEQITPPPAQRSW